jgi:type II secretory pathway component PulF
VLALLTEAGVPLDRALDQAAQLELHPRYCRLFQRLRDGVRQGDALSQCCAKEGIALPGSFGALIGVGEQSGMLPDAFRQLADLYEQDVQHGTRIASDLIMPAGVLVLAALTLWFEVSLFGTVIAMSDAVLGGN